MDTSSKFGHFFIVYEDGTRLSNLNLSLANISPANGILLSSTNGATSIETIGVQASADLTLLGVDRTKRIVKMGYTVLALNGGALSETIRPRIQIDCDIDGDGISEIFYTITNERLANVDFESASIKNYSTIIMIKNNKIYKLDTDTSSPFSINDIIDLDGDGKYEIIVSKGVLDTPTFDSCYQIYNFKDDKFERLMDCK